MNKGKGIGIVVSVIAVAIVVGIATLPDEVLLESPSVDNSETETMNLPISVIEEPEETMPEETMPEETMPEETIPEETIPEETIPEETKDDGNVIEVRIKDGIGSGDK